MAKHLRTLILIFLLVPTLSYSLTLKGNVYDKEQSRLSNVNVSAFLGDVLLDSFLVELGYYELMLPKGTYFIVAQKNYFQPTVLKVSLTNDAIIDIYLRERTGYYLYGRVIGNNISRKIDLYSENIRVASDTLTNEGLFLFSGLPKGRYTLRVNIDNVDVSKEVELSDDLQIILMKITKKEEPIEQKESEAETRLLLVPETGRVNQTIYGYYSHEDTRIEILETNSAVSVVNNTFILRFNQPGRYTIKAGNLIRTINIENSVFPEQKKIEIQSSKESNLSFYVIALSFLLFAGVGMLLIKSFFSKKARKKPY